MKKTLFTLAVLSFLALPSSSWQIYNRNIDLLKVFKTNNIADGICYEGKAEDYNGQCVFPFAPTTEYYYKYMQGENYQR